MALHVQYLLKSILCNSHEQIQQLMTLGSCNPFSFILELLPRVSSQSSNHQGGHQGHWTLDDQWDTRREDHLGSLSRAPLIWSAAGRMPVSPKRFQDRARRYQSLGRVGDSRSPSWEGYPSSPVLVRETRIPQYWLGVPSLGGGSPVLAPEWGSPPPPKKDLRPEAGEGIWNQRLSTPTPPPKDLGKGTVEGIWNQRLGYL